MVNEIQSVGPAVNGQSLAFSDAANKRDMNPTAQEAIEKKGVSHKDVVAAVAGVQKFADAVLSDTNLAFSIVEELSRTVVAVRAVGSDEIIRQFPPEEFLTVAKFIAGQNPAEMSDEVLKGMLFDQFT